MIIEWNKTQQRQTLNDQKRVYCMRKISIRIVWKLTISLDLSLEFLMGRALDNAMLNVGMKDVARGTSRMSVMTVPMLTHMSHM